VEDTQQIPEQPAESGGEKTDPRKNLREIVNQILPDSLMIVLALVMIPVVLVPLFFSLPASVATSLKSVDYIILAIFVIEYLSKLILAPNILKHFLNPWHLLDLFVIVVPLVSLLPMFSNKLARSSLILRLLRIIRIVAVGGRTVDRRLQLASSAPAREETVNLPVSIQIMDERLTDNYELFSFVDLKKYLDSPSHTWANISSVSTLDLDQLSDTLGIPKILLESELIEESYPRVDYFDDYSMIFSRVADVQISHKGLTRLLINRTGLLIICKGQNILTVSKNRTDFFRQIIEEAKKIHTPEDPVDVTILYTILKHILEKDKKIITALEKELMSLESIPLNKRPDNFLETAFHLRKEVNQLVPSLLHMKEIISVITSKRVPLEGFNEKHEKIFDILEDESAYLHETASNVRDNLQSLVDLYINTTSFEMNKVMRLIAVITSLGIIPAIILGALGTNLIDNPWNINLWQVFSFVIVLMLMMGWIFYRLGWMKGS
jgi:Mg2+ and Co2+ transporter CorA